MPRERVGARRRRSPRPALLRANGHGDAAPTQRPRRSAPLRESLAHRRARGARGVRATPASSRATTDAGVIVGSGAGGIDVAERQYGEYFSGAFHRVSPYAIPVSIVGIVSSEISIALGLRGISHVLSTGCTSSTDAIGYAAALIRQGEADVLLTGGADACATPGMIFGFCRMRVDVDATTTIGRPRRRGRSIAGATGSCWARARG